MNRCLYQFCLLFAVVFLFGCGTTPLLDIPFDESEWQEPDSRLVGRWKSNGGEELIVESMEKNLLQIHILSKDESQKPLLPLIGAVTEFEKNTYLIVFADIKKVLQEEYDEDSAFFLIPAFYLFQMEIQNDDLILKMVCFADQPSQKLSEKKESVVLETYEIPGSNWRPFSPEVRMKRNLVLNAGKEVKELIRNKLFILKDFSELKRIPVSVPENSQSD